MLNIHSTRDLVVALIGGLMLVAALVAGASFGTLTSPEAPAHADTTKPTPTGQPCPGLCGQASIGGGGAIPGPDLGNLTSQGSGGSMPD